MKQSTPTSRSSSVPTSSSAAGQACWEAWAWVALALVILTGLALRGIVVFAGELPRGINGGYYPVQVRAILRSGALALPDFPLLFYVQTLLALLLRPFCVDLGRAILLATRVTDTVLPCLAALPVFLLARAWVPMSRRANLPIVVLVAGLVVVANPMVLRMAGDMQKNSAALGLTLLFVVYADRYLRTQRPAAACGALVALGLTGLTHLGVFGVTLLLAVLLGATAGWDSRHRGRLLVALPLAAAVAAVVALLIFVLFDPTRIERLLGYVGSPARLFHHGRVGGGQGPGPGPAGPGGPAGFLLRPEVLPGLLLGAIGVWMWLLFLEVDRAQRQTVLACSLAALALACPWLNPDLGSRLALMAVVPGSIGVVFALAHWPRAWGCALVGGAIAALTIVGGWRQLRQGPPGSLSREARADLLQIATQIKDPARTLIVARHGLEWWTAWFTGARIANNLRVVLPVWDRYDQVFSLVEMGAPQGFPPMGGPGQGPGMQPGMGPGMQPGMGPGMQPGMGPGMQPGMGPGMQPGMGPGMQQPEPGGMDPGWRPPPEAPFPPAPGARGGEPAPEALSLRELDAWLSQPLLPGPGRPPAAGERRGIPAGARAATLAPAYRGSALLLQRFLAKPPAMPEPPGR